jgi:hypothetical protein
MDPNQLALLREVIDAKIAARKARMARIGAIGGRSKSQRKLASCMVNVKKAQAARWPNRPQVERHE